MSTQITNAKIQEIYTDMGYFKNKNYCIDQYVHVEDMSEGWGVNNFTIIEKKNIKNNFKKKTTYCPYRVSNPGRQARRRACYPLSYFS